MYMSNADIIKEYKEAKDRSAQVKILADQNCCSVEQIIGILVDGGIDHRCFSQLRRKQNQAAVSAAEEVVKEKIPYKKPEIIPAPPKPDKLPTVEQAVEAIKAQIAEINRQQYALDLRKADLYRTIWDMLGEVE